MRFHFTSVERPKSLAKNLKKLLAIHGKEIALGESQGIVARMMGYRDWQDLSHSIGTQPPSVDDEHCDRDTVEARQRQYVSTLVSAGMTRQVAEAMVEALHPSCVRRREYSDWEAFKDGELRVADGMAYFVRLRRPEDPDHLLHPRSRFQQGSALLFEGKMAGSTPKFDNLFYPDGREFELIDQAKSRADDAILVRRTHAAELNLLPKRVMRELDVDSLSEEDRDTPWGEADSAVEVATGLFEFGTASHGGFRVSRDLLASMPEFLRMEPDEFGYGWYEEDDEACLVRLAFPEIYTETERRGALESARFSFPKVVALYEGKWGQTPEYLRLAKKELNGPNYEWGIVEQTDHGDMVKCRTRLSGFHGILPFESEKFWQKEWIFVVPRAELTERYARDLNDETPRHWRDGYINEETDPVELDGELVPFSVALERCRGELADTIDDDPKPPS